MTNKFKISNGMNLKKIAIWALLATSLTPFIVMKNNIAPYIGGKVLFLKLISFLVVFFITFILCSGKKKRKKIFLKV